MQVRTSSQPNLSDQIMKCRRRLGAQPSACVEQACSRLMPFTSLCPLKSGLRLPRSPERQANCGFLKTAAALSQSDRNGLIQLPDMNEQTGKGGTAEKTGSGFTPSPGAKTA